MNHHNEVIPMVSVFVITYNHQEYIKMTLDGILMQEVDFDYEIVIGDDASTDKTPEILKEYAKKFPDKFKLILRKKNLGTGENSRSLSKECRGKYIAYCEGDDYWITSEKLKKQVDFLEKNPNYMATTHDFEVINEYNEVIAPSSELKHYFSGNEFMIEDVEKGLLPGQTATLVCRNIFIDKNIDIAPLLECRTNGDRKTTLFLLLYGKIYRFDEIMSYYRRVNYGDSWTARAQSKNMFLHYHNSFNELSKLSEKVRGKVLDFGNKYYENVTSSFFFMMKKPTKENIIIFKEIFGDLDKKTHLAKFILKRLLRKRY